MKGDFTRDTFNPRNHYSRVLLQQGRVQLDADWNEQSAIVLHYLRSLARDLIGPHGGSQNGKGFEIVTRMESVFTLDGQQLSPADERWTELKNAIDRNEFVINPGRYYVDGILVENEEPIAYSMQPGFRPATEELKIFPYLIYLDVWERHVNYVEDGHIREVALGGPDTASRAQIVWQVRFRGGGSPCLLPEDLRPLGTGKLRARAKQDQPQTDLCVIPPDSRYRGAENQLYRVEVHRGGTADSSPSPTFKWSRENGSVVFPVIEVSSVGRDKTQVNVRLVNLGRDQRFGLLEGDWVEIVDDDYVVQNRADPLLRVVKIDREQLRVTLASKQQIELTSGKNKLLRRWDHQGDPNFDGALKIVEGIWPPPSISARDVGSAWTALEDGVQILFDKGAGAVYNTGDYWLIPARTATGDVEWPHELKPDGSEKQDDNKNPIPAPLPANGPRHHYAPLAFRTALRDLQVCRNCISSLVHICPNPSSGP